MGLLSFLGEKILGIAAKKPEESLVGKALMRVIPDKQGQERFLAEIEKEYAENEHEYEMDFMEVVKESQQIYEWEPKFSQILKGSTRWIIAIMFASFYIYQRIVGMSISPLDEKIILGIIGFLFILRSVEKNLKRTR